MKNNVLNISDGLALPLDAVTQTGAIIAKKRRGKTYTASVMAEEFIKHGLPFVVLDPTGAWWGLRASADGKRGGFPVVIIGGDHGDIPLESTAGSVIADLVVEHPGFYIIDMSQMNSNAEQDRFATEFGERLYRAKNKHRFPMALFVDEADAFIPQQPMPDQRRMLGAYDTIVRRGGIRGIGCWLITQRAAAMSKNVLYQCECLVALQILGKHDRDTIEGWVKQDGSKEQCAALMDSLASLGLGEAWFWSPVWLEVFKKVQIRKRETFNSSKTPEVGDLPVQPKVLAPVDLDQIRSLVAATIERTKSDDPRELRKLIADLRCQLSEMEARKVVKAGPVKVKTIDVPAVGKQAYTGLLKMATVLGKHLDKIRALYNVYGVDLLRLEKLKADLDKQLAKINADQHRAHAPVQVKVVHPVSKTFGDAVVAINGTDALGKAERAILAVLKTHGPCKVARLCLLAGYKWSGSFSNALGALRTAKLISGSNTDTITITDTGFLAAMDVPMMPTGQALRDYWLGRFGAAEKKILQALFDHYPNGLSRDDLCTETGYAWSGSFSNALGRLRTAGVLVGSNNHVMKPSEDLFE